MQVVHATKQTLFFGNHLLTTRGEARRNVHTCHVPETHGMFDMQVHRDVFKQIFQIGDRKIQNAQWKHYTVVLDLRASLSERKSHVQLRSQIDVIIMTLQHYYV